ncbi:MAG: cysteine hydrolase family protein [Negativicutes bacterium]
MILGTPALAAVETTEQTIIDEWKSVSIPVAPELKPVTLGKPEQILPAVAPLQGEPAVSSSVDKFYNTDLEKILKARGIKTVVIVGTAANGAVLHTAVGAAVRGMQVVIPVDGMSSIDPYAEQYTAWHMMNGPGTRNRATLTRFSLISFK